MPLCDGFVYCHPSGGVRYHALLGLVGASSDRELVTLPSDGGQVIGDYKVEMNETVNDQATRHETDSTHNRTVLHNRTSKSQSRCLYNVFTENLNRQKNL